MREKIPHDGLPVRTMSFRLRLIIFTKGSGPATPAPAVRVTDCNRSQSGVFPIRRRGCRHLDQSQIHKLQQSLPRGQRDVIQGGRLTKLCPHIATDARQASAPEAARSRPKMPRAASRPRGSAPSARRNPAPALRLPMPGGQGVDREGGCKLTANFVNHASPQPVFSSHHRPRRDMQVPD
jgi:hypothetical protein